MKTKKKRKGALFCSTNGKLHVNAFIKLGNQYGYRRIVLPNRDILVCIFQDSTAVVVHVQIVRHGKDGRKVAFGGTWCI